MLSYKRYLFNMCAMADARTSTVNISVWLEWHDNENAIEASLRAAAGSARLLPFPAPVNISCIFFGITVYMGY